VALVCVTQVYIARRDYRAGDEDELSFSKGEQIFVAREDDDGWWLAVRQVDGAVGYVLHTVASLAVDSAHGSITLYVQRCA
jgi:hypothetical protein